MQFRREASRPAPWQLLKVILARENAFACDDGPEAPIEMLKTLREVVKVSEMWRRSTGRKRHP